MFEIVADFMLRTYLLFVFVFMHCELNNTLMMKQTFLVNATHWMPQAILEPHFGLSTLVTSHDCWVWLWAHFKWFKREKNATNSHNISLCAAEICFYAKIIGIIQMKFGWNAGWNLCIKLFIEVSYRWFETRSNTDLNGIK